MNGLIISQTEPVSSLPRKYFQFLKRVNKENEPIVFLKRNKPIGALVSWKLLESFLETKKKLEEKEALSNIVQSEKEFKQGKAKILKTLSSL